MAAELSNDLGSPTAALKASWPCLEQAMGVKNQIVGERAKRGQLRSQARAVVTASLARNAPEAKTACSCPGGCHERSYC